MAKNPERRKLKMVRTRRSFADAMHTIAKLTGKTQTELMDRALEEWIQLNYPEVLDLIIRQQKEQTKLEEDAAKKN